MKKAVDILNVEEKPALVLKIAPDLVESEMKDIATVSYCIQNIDCHLQDTVLILPSIGRS